MDIKQLRYFCAVFEKKNLSHASQQCCVAQSALSHHLSNLEAELQVKLFERLPRGMEPTPEGARLYEHARSILRSIEVASEDIKEMSANITGTLRLGLPHTVIDAIAVPMLTRIRDELPHAEVILHEAFSNVLFDELTGGHLDLTLIYNPPHDDRIKLTTVHHEPLCCAGHPDLIGEKEVPISLADATSLPQIVLHRGDAARSVSNQLRLQQAMSASKLFEFNSVNGMRRSIEAGLATVICPYITVRDLVEAGRVIARPIIDPTPIRRLDWVRLNERLPTQLAIAVQQMVTELIAAQTENGNWPITTPSDSNEKGI